jgi:hypothetical protein
MPTVDRSTFSLAGFTRSFRSIKHCRREASPRRSPRTHQLLKDSSHELAMLLGLIVDWGGTGATNSGLGTAYSMFTPTFYFGKGLGDLPEDAAGCEPSR